MKQNILKFICGVSMIASFSSCDDLFEPALENNQDITQMYTWPDFARGLLDNAFLVLPYDENPTSDVATDDAVSNDNDNNYKKMATGAWTSQNNPINQWDVRYHAIQYCNLFLENCDKVLWDYSSETLNQMHLDLYKGQAYALRGLHMFYLLRAHAGKVNGEVVGVPIHLTSEDGTSDFNLPRNSFKECIDQILADFDEALKYLPMEYGDVKTMPAKYAGGSTAEYNRAFGSLQRGKIDGRMIAAFKAQVALFAASPAYASAGVMTWEQAAEYAAKSLNNVGGVAGVDPDGWRWYANVDFIDAFGFTDPDPLEICWRGVVTDEKNLEKEQNNYPPSLDGKGRVNPSQNLVDAFPMANGYPITDAKSQYDAKNPYENRDPRLKTYILVNGEKIGANGSVINTAADNEGLDGIDRENGKSTKTGYYLHKLLRDDINVTTSQGAKHFGARIRYTEIFLDYAEAANEAQGPKANVGGANYSAYDVIKALRKRAGVGGANDPYLEECAQSKDKMRELIRNERRLELCFENHRFWDLRRWNANLTEAAKGVKITTGTDGKLVYTPIDVEARDYKDYMIYGPIPYSEVLKWSSLQQNDGWK
jgi:hypothetical protein